MFKIGRPESIIHHLRHDFWVVIYLITDLYNNANLINYQPSPDIRSEAA